MLNFFSDLLLGYKFFCHFQGGKISLKLKQVS